LGRGSVRRMCRATPACSALPTGPHRWPIRVLDRHLDDIVRIRKELAQAGYDAGARPSGPTCAGPTAGSRCLATHTALGDHVGFYGPAQSAICDFVATIASCNRRNPG
jgi:hypothetical protein